MKILQESSCNWEKYLSRSKRCMAEKLEKANQPSARFFYMFTSLYQDTKVGTEPLYIPV